MTSMRLMLVLTIAAGVACGPDFAPPRGGESGETTPLPGDPTSSPTASDSTSTSTSRDDLPEVLFSQPDALLSARAQARTGTGNSEALSRLRGDAEKALHVGPFSVMDKPQVAASGDKHDYLSLGRYWWPDPKKPDGLPYIQIDGQVNPEGDTIPDKAQLQQLLPTVSTLAHAYFVFGDERYAEHVALLLRTWFLDPATRMNPNLEYSQIHKGHAEDLGGSGIIDARDFGVIPEAVGLIEGSRSWSVQDGLQLREWFKQYLHWLLDSPGGRDEAASTNNHVTFYWYQAIPLALFTGQPEIAREAFRNRLIGSLDDQLQPDGSQPRELKRTKPFSYSLFNLMAWSRLAMLAEARGVDLWHHEGMGGRGSLRRAFEYLLPFARGEKELNDNPPNPERMHDFARVLYRAAQHLHEPGWIELSRALMGNDVGALETELIAPSPTR